MKKKIVLKRFYHRGRGRIGFVFEWDDSLVAIIKTINGSSYSSTNSCWYADDNEETMKQILQAFRDKADIDISLLVGRQEKDNSIIPEAEQGISFPSGSGSSDLTEPENEDIEEEMIPGRTEIRNVVERQRFGPVEFRMNENDGYLVVRFTGFYDKEWIDELKTFGRVHYDKIRKEFSLPWSVLTVDSLSDYFASCGVEVRVIRTKVSDAKKQARKEIGDEIRCHELGESSKAALDLMQKDMDQVRYSKRTSETYLSLLELFFKYFSKKDPLDITDKEVSHFIQDFIIINGYSASYQNQMISAIKYYYSIAGGGKSDFQVFERPRRSRALPKVFSKEEVKRILNATRNNKHKLLLWIVYSCGLRRSEVTNILLTDLDRDRSLLHIREGKGRVDRIVPVSDKVWQKIAEYKEGYCPVKYLFEGQGGGRYSVESVYNVFKQALRKAGIKKDVGVHSLRHSYATHLHESGLDIRYIQELLGHKSTRTTEIYTHVSRRNLVAIRSPIEDMDVK